LLRALQQVLGGETYVSEQLKAKIVGAYVGHSPPGAQSPVDLLSDRELEVFELIGQGLSTREIAEHLSLSMKTVSCYRQSIKAKMGLKSGTELTRHAVHWAEVPMK